MSIPKDFPRPAIQPGGRAVPGMTILLGLLLLVAAVVIALVSLLTDAGRVSAAHGNAFLFGLEVGVVGMLGLRLVRGDVDRRLALRKLHRLQERLLSETREVTLDRDRLAGELAGELTDRAARAGVGRPVTP
jgi:hypothetical protein